MKFSPEQIAALEKAATEYEVLKDAEREATRAFIDARGRAAALHSEYAARRRETRDVDPTLMRDTMDADERRVELDAHRSKVGMDVWAHHQKMLRTFGLMVGIEEYLLPYDRS